MNWLFRASKSYYDSYFQCPPVNSTQMALRVQLSILLYCAPFLYCVVKRPVFVISNRTVVLCVATHHLGNSLPWSNLYGQTQI